MIETHRMIYKKKAATDNQSGNIFFMLIGAVALIGALTVGAGNTVKGIVTSMSEVTRKTVAEEKMQSAARLAIQASTDCDADGFVEPMPFRDAATLPHPLDGGLVPEDIGAETKDPWGTQYGYCAWDLGGSTCVDSPNRLSGGTNPAGATVAIVSAGKDRKFSSTCGFMASGGKDYTLPSSIVARWGMNNTSGTTVTDIVGGYNGVWTGGGNVVPTDGSVGSALTFDGSHYAVVSDHSGLRLPQYTVSLWVRGDNAPQSGYDEKLVDKNVNYSVHWSSTSTPVSCSHHAVGGPVQTPPTGLTFNAGQWYNLVCSYDGTALKLHVNGFEASSVTGDPPQTGADNIGIGAAADGSAMFSGDLDDVMILNAALSTDDIQGLYNSVAGLRPAVIRSIGSDDLVMEYTYNDASGIGGDDLWRIKDTKPGTAGINKDLDVAGGADLSGPLNLMKAGLILPGDDVTGPCVAATDQQLRINFSKTPAVLEICDFAGGKGWTAVSMGGGDGGDDDEEFFPINNPTPHENDYFGTSIAIDNGLLVISANGDSENGNGGVAYAGRVYIYDLATRTMLRALNNPTPTVLDNFGYSVAIDDNLIVVGAHTDDSNGDQSGISWAGRAYVFNATTGALVTALNNPTPHQSDNFGMSVSIENGVAVVGAPNDSANGNGGAVKAGRVYMFNAATGAPIRTLNNPTPHINDQFGMQVQIKDGLIVVSATGDSENGNGGVASTGRAYVFDAITGTQVTALNNPTPHTGDTFGMSVSISNGLVAVGAPGDSENGNGGINEVGRAYVFNATTGALVTALNNPMPEFYNYFGSFVSIDNGGVLIGDYLKSNRIGRAYLFHAITGALIETFDNPTPHENDYFSYGLLLKGNQVVIGADNDSENGNGGVAYAGRAYMYKISPVNAGIDMPAGAVLPDTFLKRPDAPYCTSAAPGPLVRIAESDSAHAYRTLMPANNILFSGGHSDGISAFAKNADGTLTHLDTQSASNGDSAFGMYSDGTYIYSANAYNELVAYTFNGTEFTEVASINTPGNSWDVTGFRDYLFVNDETAVRAYRFDGTSFTLSGEYSGLINDVWTDGLYLYVSKSSGMDILRFDGAGFGLVTTIGSGTNIQGSAGDGKYLFLNEGNAISVYSFDGNTATLIQRTNALGTIGSISSDGVNVYIALDNDNSLLVSRFNGGLLEVLSRRTIPDRADSIRSDGNLLYVALESGPIQVYSGVECNGTSNSPAGIAAPSSNTFSGRLALTRSGGCAIDGTGQVWCWGQAAQGTIGNGDTVNNQWSPVRINDRNAYVQITAGENFVCGIRKDGTAWCWGLDANGQLGNGSVVGVKSSPFPVSGGRRWLKLAAGETHACGIEVTGNMFCWGPGTNGRLGTGSTGNQTSPAAVVGSRKWVDVAAGRASSCGIDDSGQAWCWGLNTDGRLGTGTHITTPQTSPVLVRDPGPWRRLDAGTTQICGIKQDGSLWCWGFSENGSAGIPSIRNLTANIPMAVSEQGPWADITTDHILASNISCGIKQDGTAWCWGLEERGNFGDGGSMPATEKPVTQVLDPGPWSTIQTSKAHSCGIKTDGSLWCWGYEELGRLGDGTVAMSNYKFVPSRVRNFPTHAAWLWDENGRNITAGGTATTNITIGSTGTIGYNAPGYAHDCTNYGNSFFNDPATGHCYYKVNTAANWNNAQAACNANGGYLAAITSHSEQLKIRNAFGTADHVWIGARSFGSNWIYQGGEHYNTTFWIGLSTGTPYKNYYNNWNPGVGPTTASHCVSMFNGSSLYWQNTSCGTSVRYICEIGTAENSGGLSFPDANNTLLKQYGSGSELMVETGAGASSAQIGWKAPDAANTRIFGINQSNGNLVLGLGNADLTNWIPSTTPQMSISPEGRVSIGGTGAVYNKLEVNGSLRVGNDNDICHAMRAGTLRYDSTADEFKYCNGSGWVDF